MTCSYGSAAALCTCDHATVPAACCTPCHARLQVRKRVNALDNLLTAKAVDALMNYETVKLFTNEVSCVMHPVSWAAVHLQ